MKINNEVKLDKLDLKLLTELDKNSRQTLSVLSKKLHKSRSILDYKIRRLERIGMIQNYVTLLDPGKLGLMIWNIYLEFENTTPAIEKEISAYVSDHPRVWWAAMTAGTWGLVFSVAVRTIKELELLLRVFSEKFGHYILRQSIVAHGEVDIISRGYFSGQPGFAVKFFTGYSLIKITPSDSKILSIIGTRARATLIDLAKETKLTVKTVAKRLKILEKNGTIIRYRLQIAIQKAGMQFYKAILFLKNNSKEKENNLLRYCIELGNVFHFERKIGSWPLELELESEGYESCESLLHKMKEHFPDYIKSYELLLIKDEIKGELDLTKFV